MKILKHSLQAFPNLILNFRISQKENEKTKSKGRKEKEMINEIYPKIIIY